MNNYKNLDDLIFPPSELKPTTGQIYKSVNEKVTFYCSCGNTKEITIKSVTSGLTKSCGCILKNPTGIKWSKPEYISKEKWFEALANTDIKIVDNSRIPYEWSRGSGRIFTFICQCGNEYDAKFCDVYAGKRKGCSRCKFITKEEILSKKYGKLTIIDENLPETVHRGTNTKYKIQCDCGNVKLIQLSKVLSGNTVSCNDCTLFTIRKSVGKKINNLTIVNILPSRNRKGQNNKKDCILLVRCSCGNECAKPASQVMNGLLITCGNCINVSMKARIDNPFPHLIGPYIDNKDIIIEWSKGQKVNVIDVHNSGKCDAVCVLCGREMHPMVTDFKRGKILSCGCANGTLSQKVIELTNLIKSYHIEVLNEYPLFGNTKLDIFIPAFNLGIEYHGLRWHDDNSKKRELNKLKLCRDNSISLMVVYEDEWKYNKSKITDIILNRLSLIVAKIKIRPQHTTVKTITYNESAEFYEKYHYIGKKSGIYHIGVYHIGNLIACMTISNTTRQSKEAYEITRMVKHYDYTVYGLWSYVMKWIINELNIVGELCTYADDRLFSGAVYNKMGFTTKSHVAPNYYWTDNNRRYNKSAFRLKPDEKMAGVTEKRSRETQGYHRIWDIGKTKYSINIIQSHTKL